MRAVGARMLLSSSTPFIAYSSSLASDSAPGASTMSILKPDLRKTDVSSLVHHEALQRVSDRCRHRFSCVCVATWPRMCWCGQPMACTQVHNTCKAAFAGMLVSTLCDRVVAMHADLRFDTTQLHPVAAAAGLTLFTGADPLLL